MSVETKRILVVDDQPRDTKLLKQYLERSAAYEVREENDAKAALGTALEFRPHLILLDVMMPALDGGELAALFQASPELCDVPVVFLTSAVRKAEVDAHGGQLGGHQFIAKPVILADLATFLSQHFNA